MQHFDLQKGKKEKEKKKNTFHVKLFGTRATSRNILKN